MRRKRAVERRSAHGVRALLEHDAAVERWLREEVVAGHMEYMADSSKGIPVEKVFERLRARQRAKSGLTVGCAGHFTARAERPR